MSYVNSGEEKVITLRDRLNSSSSFFSPVKITYHDENTFEIEAWCWSDSWRCDRNMINCIKLRLKNWTIFFFRSSLQCHMLDGATKWKKREREGLTPDHHYCRVALWRREKRNYEVYDDTPLQLYMTIMMNKTNHWRLFEISINVHNEGEQITQCVEERKTKCAREVEIMWMMISKGLERCI